MYALELIQRSGFAFTFRWLHIIMGITWIGLLYYFNLVQVPAFAEMSASSRTEAIEVLAKRALWWFRWAAVATVLTGLLIMGATKDYFTDFGKSPNGVSISTGILLALIMFVNVWGIIWRNNKKIIRGTIAGTPPADGPTLARQAFLASRTNMFLSVPMLFFMAAASHYGILGK